MGLSIGSNVISKIYIGATEVLKIFLGSTQVFPSTEPSSGNTWTLEYQRNGLTVSEEPIATLPYLFLDWTEAQAQFNIISLSSDGSSFEYEGILGGSSAGTFTVTQQNPDDQLNAVYPCELSLASPYHIVFNDKS